MDKKIINYIVTTAADTRKNIQRTKRDFDVTVQAGAALTDERIPDALYDNTGDNISSKNKQYCELTALYWLWKNADSDYYGIEHYRRTFALEPDTVSRLFCEEKVDAIIPKKVLLYESNESQYKQYTCHDTWECMMQTLQKLYPNDYLCAKTIFAENFLYPCNMGFFSKKFLNDYCSWLFPILENVCSIIGTKWDAYQNRYPGFLSERLFTLFVAMNWKNYHFFESPVVMLDDSNAKAPSAEGAKIGHIVNLVQHHNISEAYKYIHTKISPQVVRNSAILSNLENVLRLAYYEIFDIGDVYSLRNCNTLDDLMNAYHQKFHRPNSYNAMNVAVYAAGDQRDEQTRSLIKLYNSAAAKNPDAVSLHISVYMAKSSEILLFNDNKMNLYMDVESVIQLYLKNMISAVIIPTYCYLYQDDIITTLITRGVDTEDIYILKSVSDLNVSAYNALSLMEPYPSVK